jgi:hypothetical protein
MKIFKNNLKNLSKIVYLDASSKNLSNIGIMKYLPSFSKEWKNTIYSYNKNILKNIPVNTLDINKIIQSYFNLFILDSKYLGNSKKLYRFLKNRRKFLNRVYVSNAEIKHTNNKAIITLFAVNKEKKIYMNKYLVLNKILSKNLIKRYLYLYKNNITTINNVLIKFNKYFLSAASSKFMTPKKEYILNKFIYLNKFLFLKNLYLKKIWSILLTKYSSLHLDILRKSYISYSLNQAKFNKFLFLPYLSKILGGILRKKIQYNIINLKSITYNTDIFTNILTLKLTKKKNYNYSRSALKIINRAPIPIVNTISERTQVKIKDYFLNKYKDDKILSHLGLAQSSPNSLSGFLDTIHKDKNIHNTIYNDIKYKNLGGIRIEIGGRLTKRYRADRAIQYKKWKGGLKNIDSSFKNLSAILYRGNTNSNVNYSLSIGKRRVGSFAVKGWIGGK